METEAIAHPMQRATHEPLGCSVLPPNPSHQGATALNGEAIHAQRLGYRMAVTQRGTPFIGGCRFGRSRINGIGGIVRTPVSIPANADLSLRADYHLTEG